MTHEHELCLIFIKNNQGAEVDDSSSGSRDKARPPCVLNPLFGVLKEEQVGINPNTGRPRMAADVLEGMRQYLMVTNGEERKIREERVRKFIKDVEKDPMAQKMVLRLEPAPVVSKDLDNWKGLIFGYESSGSINRVEPSVDNDQKLLSAAINFGRAMRWSSKPEQHQSASCRPMQVEDLGFLSGDPKVFRMGLYEAIPSGMKPKKGKPRKRPQKSKENLKALMRR